MKTISLIIILLLIFAGNLSANRYYVDADYGNDSNSGESESSAWKTLDKVNYPLNPFNANDIISFKCGSIFYDQTLIPPGSNLVFNSYGSGPRPVIDAEGDSVNLRMCVAVSDPRTNLRFEGIKFIHGWLSCLSFWNSSNVTINNCDVESALQTSYTQAAPGMLYVGGSISAQVNHWTVTNSTFNYSLYGHAMYWDGVKDILLDHDTIMYNGANGVQICSSLDTVNNGSNMDIIKNIADSVIVRYCVIRQNATYGYGETGLFINSATNSKFYYNVIENHSISTYSGCIQLENNYGTPPSNSGFYNNTIICHGGGHIAIYLGGDGAWTGMDSLYFKNNLIYSDDPNCYALYMSVLIGTNSQFTNNLYYYPAGGTRLFHMGPDDPIYDYPDIFTWKTASYNFTTPAGGYEAGSVTDAVNATFDSIFSNLQLKNGSNAISKGVYLGLTQDITGKYVSDPPDIGAYQNSIYLSGTLSANTTLNGNVAVTGNVTTPTNVTLTI
ncbi:MAG: hypothetical protein P4L35_02460, partial [Ignavibacteriaceae bacterium]|nr:hypothetical protein [Ignavibacteriaceae bacterium]